MERREFLGWVGTGTIASFLPVAIAACSPGQTGDTASTDTTTSDTAVADASSGSTLEAEGFTNIGAVTDLDTSGFLYDEAANVIVVRLEDGSPSALNPKCTHKQCPVQWDTSSSTLVCPCHGSAFATDGSVVTGPAPTALASYEVTEDGGMVWVKTS